MSAGKKVTLKIDSPGFNLIYNGIILEISSDSIEYDEAGKDGQRYYQVNILPEVMPFEGTACLADTRGNLENPAPASYQSGISVFSGWACELYAGFLKIIAATERIITAKIDRFTDFIMTIF